MLRRQDLPNLVAGFLADGIELGIRLLLSGSESAGGALQDLLELRDLRIGKVEFALDALDEALPVEGAAPVPGAPGVVIDGSSADDHTQQKCQGEIEVGSSAHGFL